MADNTERLREQERRIEKLEQRLERLEEVVADFVGACNTDDLYPTKSSTPDPNPWRTHDGDQMPGCYAPAQVIGIMGSRYDTWQAAKVPWTEGIVHRPVLRDGLPVVSAEGLESWARYVATGGNGNVSQYDRRPTLFSKGAYAPAPATHAIPGPWRESLAIVEGR